MQMGLVALAMVVATGCRNSPRLARTDPARPTLEATGPLSWIDRKAGVVQLEFRCLPTTIEVWCRGEHSPTCEGRRILDTPSVCSGEDEVSLTTPWGTRAAAMVPRHGRATFTVDVTSAPWNGVALEPGEQWQVEQDGRRLGWRVGDKIRTEPEQVPVPKPKVRQRSYAFTMGVVDFVIFASAVPVIEIADDHGAGMHVGAGYVAAYVLSGSVIHSLHGNGKASTASVGSRLGFPVLGALAGGIIGAPSGGGFGALVFGIIGGGVGLVVGAVNDWRYAHVDIAPAGVVPVVTADRDQVMFGAAGRF